VKSRNFERVFLLEEVFLLLFLVCCRFNKKLVVFSGVFLVASYVFTRLFGSVGFFIANSLNMALRVGQR
jgi:hypothetical protein